MKIKLTANNVQYHIEVEPSCFTPYKHGTTEKGGEKLTCLGYPSTLSRAVQMIIREELCSSAETVSLMEYVERHELLADELKNVLDFQK